MQFPESFGSGKLLSWGGRNMSEKTAILFDIGRFRNTDGPGIRTILFFKDVLCGAGGAAIPLDWRPGPSWR